MAISLYTVGTSGRFHGESETLVNPYTVLSTNGRYDKLMSPVIIEMDAKKPFLQFAMKVPKIEMDAKKPFLQFTMKTSRRRHK